MAAKPNQSNRVSTECHLDLVAFSLYICRMALKLGPFDLFGRRVYPVHTEARAAHRVSGLWMLFSGNLPKHS